ncbi:MAG: SMP-30/gluconolactonase/LRE family protein [Gemmatimonadota bacterium]
MGRTLLIGLLALALSACDDPLVIVGDLPGFMRVTAGIADSSGTRVDTLALRTRLVRPAGLVLSSTGVLYFGDQSSRIFSVTSAGKLTVLHSSVGCFQKTCLGRVQGIALSADETALLIADDMSDKIWRFTLANRELRALAGTGINAVAPDGTVAAQATLASPTGVAALSDGRILIAERNAHKIRVISTDGLLLTFAGTGSAGQASDGAQAAASPLSLPTAMSVSNGVLYVTETLTHTVRAIDVATGTIRLVAGRGSAGFSGDGGAGTEAALNNPWAVAVSDDNLYIADQLNHRVRVVNLRTGLIATYAGTGTTRFTGNGRAAGETSVSSPSGLTVSPFGYLYISDWGHSVIWRTPVRLGTN